MTYRGRTAIVTGASSGIGEAFARALAARGMRLFLTALPADQAALTTIAADLAAAHGIETGTLAIDMGGRDSAVAIQAAADRAGFEPDLLVNNAGIGVSRAVAEATVEAQLAVVRVNVEALVGLTAAYLPRMVQRQDGAVINVASASAFHPLPYAAVYAASKAFVLRFTEAVWAEAHRSGVRVVAICPGIVVTRFHETFAEGDPKTPRTWKVLAGFGRVLRHLRMKPLTVDMVVARALEGLERDQPVAVRRAPGALLIYIPALCISRALPQRLRLLTYERLFRPPSA